MQITKVKIRPANEDFLKPIASICIDDCFLVHDIRVIKGLTGFFISFPNRTQSEGGQRDIAFPVNAETRNMTEQALLAEYERVVGTSDPVQSARSTAELRDGGTELGSVPGEDRRLAALYFKCC